MIKDKNTEPDELGEDKASGNPILLKKGRYGPYLQCGDKMKSLPPGVTDTNITEEIACKIVEMPKDIGTDSKSKNSIPI